MQEKFLGITSFGNMFYSYLNKDDSINESSIIPNEEFENAILLYLAECSRTNDFKKPYDIKLPQYQKEFRITVEVINEDDIDG